MKKILFIAISILILLAGCQRNAPSDNQGAIAIQPQSAGDIGSAPDSGCGCSDEFDPVCADGQLVNNACTADCMGIKNYVKGECNTLTGKQLFPCGETGGGINPQHSNVCGHVTEVDTGVTYWKTYPSSYTACNVYKMSKLEVKEFTRGECG